MKITAEDLQHIQHIKKVVGGRNVNVFVGVVSGEMFLQVDYKDRHYREVITPHMCKNEPKKITIDRFAHYAKKYFIVA